ncbi:MAG: pilin [bacterium]|nr:pilin [bacterium]
MLLNKIKRKSLYLFTGLLFFGVFFGFLGVESVEATDTKCCLFKANYRSIVTIAPKTKYYKKAPPKGTESQMSFWPNCRLALPEPCREEYVPTVYDFEQVWRIEETIECKQNKPCIFFGEGVFEELGRKKEISFFTCDDKLKDGCRSGEGSIWCVWVELLGECRSQKDSSACRHMTLTECNVGGDDVCQVQDGKCIDIYQQWLNQAYGGSQTGEGSVGKFLPACARLGTCTDINDVVGTFINITKEVFKYVGAIAFAFFIYGGGLMVLSFGNAERFKKGQTVLTSAVIGLVIVFSGYFIVGFILEVLGLHSTSNIFR